MKIIWSPLAVDRVFEIAEYIALDKPSAAADWVDTVFESVKRLNKFPRSGRIVPRNQRVRSCVMPFLISHLCRV